MHISIHNLSWGKKKKKYWFNWKFDVYHKNGDIYVADATAPSDKLCEYMAAEATYQCATRTQFLTVKGYAWA